MLTWAGIQGQNGGGRVEGRDESRECDRCGLWCRWTSDASDVGRKSGRSLAAGDSAASELQSGKRGFLSLVRQVHPPLQLLFRLNPLTHILLPQLANWSPPHTPLFSRKRESRAIRRKSISSRTCDDLYGASGSRFFTRVCQRPFPVLESLTADKCLAPDTRLGKQLIRKRAFALAEADS